jgi:hypothetical protein
MASLATLINRGIYGVDKIMKFLPRIDFKEEGVDRIHVRNVIS